MQHRQQAASRDASSGAALSSSNSAGGGGHPAVVTNASLKLLAWLADYAALTRCASATLTTRVLYYRCVINTDDTAWCCVRCWC